MASIITQEKRPLIFTLLTSASVGLVAQLSFPPLLTIFGSPGTIHPEGYTYRRPSRGSVINTLDAAFLDDFGEGVGSISIEGHTGWGGGDEGLTQFKNLELIFEEYHIRRDTIANADIGVDPSIIQLWLLDTLNFEASSVYPEEFILTRSKNRPLLYQYQIRLIVLQDLLKDALTALSAQPVSGGSLAPSLNSYPAIIKEVATLGGSISSILTNFIA